jgi:uncharacterized protein (DUF302 family)
MRTLTTFLVTTMLVCTPALAGGIEGMIRKPSPHSVTKTLDRLEAVLEEKGITVALRWPHGERAAGVDIELRDTEVMIFGNPRIGSHLMTSSQTAGIDLPMKALAWRDADGRVWLAWNDPAYLAARHGIDDRAEVVQKMSGALDKLTAAAVAPE